MSDDHEGSPVERQAPPMRDALADAARRSALGRVAPGRTPSGRDLLGAIGGVRGLIESILPGLVFLVVFTLTQELLPSVLIPVAVGVVFVAARLVSRSPATPAIAGLVGIAASALLALWSGRAEDNFVLGFVINGAWLLGLLATLIARWPLVGVIAGALTGDASGWRADPAKVRVARVGTVLWIGLFALRLAVQVPLYLAGQTQLLAASKLLMGVPLYAGLLWVTWLLARAAYGTATERE